MIPAAQTLASNGGYLTAPIPMSYIGIAPYVGTPLNDATFNAAVDPSGGNWSCTEILAWACHYFKYSAAFWETISSQITAIAPYGTNGGPTGYTGQVDGLPALISYEGAMGGIDGTDGQMRDLYYTPGPYPPYTGFQAVLNALFQSCQDGDPRYPGGGFQEFTYTALGGGFAPGNDLWNLVVWQGQSIGPGVDNAFCTAQGRPEATIPAPTATASRTTSPTRRSPSTRYWPGTRSRTPSARRRRSRSRRRGSRRTSRRR